MSGAQRMTIHRMLQNTPLEPEDIERLVWAYEKTLNALSLKGRDDPLTELVAKKVIEIGQTGIRDPAQISLLAIKKLKLYLGRPG
jgi:hypothetical protein